MKSYISGLIASIFLAGTVSDQNEVVRPVFAVCTQEKDGYESCLVTMENDTRVLTIAKPPEISQFEITSPNGVSRYVFQGHDPMTYDSGGYRFRPNNSAEAVIGLIVHQNAMDAYRNDISRIANEINEHEKLAKETENLIRHLQRQNCTELINFWEDLAKKNPENNTYSGLAKRLGETGCD